MRTAADELYSAVDRSVHIAASRAISLGDSIFSIGSEMEYQIYLPICQGLSDLTAQATEEGVEGK